MASGSRESHRPSLLLVSTDQQRVDGLGAYGNPVIQTPYLDRLAREGICFSQCYVQNPICISSRATFFTGRYVRSHGVWCNGAPSAPDQQSLAPVLAAAGYAAVAIGKLHFRSTGAPAPPGWWGTLETHVDPNRPPKHMQVFLDAQNFVHVDSQAINWPQIQILIDKGFGDIWNGGQSARQGTRQLVPKGNALLNQS